MNVQFGFCDFLFDANSSAVIGEAWAAHTRAFGVELVRGPVATSTNGEMPTGLMRTAIEAYGAVGIDVLAEFTPAFLPVSIATGEHSNMPLNTSGDTFTSPWIDGVTLRGEGVARQAAKSGLRCAIFGNEPNSSGLLPVGEVAHAGALAPQIAAATYWQAASRLRAAGMGEVYCGALSVLPQTGIDAKNPYYAAWLEQFYAACAAHGKHAPFPWAGWGLNMEGVWAAQSLAAALAVLRGVMTRYGDSGKLRITEWGWQAGPQVDALAAAQTVAAIGQSEVVSATFFQGPGATPYLGEPSLYKGFGAWQYRQNGGTLIPQGDYVWGSVLRPLFAAP